MVPHSRAPALLAALFAALLTGTNAICPYHMLWMEGSPMKLPDDHPALRGGDDAAATRALLQADGDGAPDATEFPIGAGSCAYTSPMTQSRSCVQFTGDKWMSSPGEAESLCTEEGPSPGAADGAYDADALCDEFADPDFAGVCLRDAGEAEEMRTAFVSVPDDPSTSCEVLRGACEAFGGGLFEGRGGKCGAGGGGRAPSVNTSAPCQLSPGISGGGHIHTDSYWDSTCENQGSEYAMPLRWAAATESVLVQKGARNAGYVYYDIANNRKRLDWVVVEGNGFAVFNATNTTVIHEHGVMRIVDWDTGLCRKLNLPVGNIRSNWVLDSRGGGAVSQYLGSTYILYDGEYRHVRQWRKTEPLENAFMIQSYDEETEWETPEGLKRRVLMRQTPGGPGQGDSVDLYYNHTTDYDDSVFDILDGIDCQAPDSAGGAGLNNNSVLHIDSGFVRVDCEDCGLVYSDKEAEEKEEQESVERRDAAVYFNGTEVLSEESYLELNWEYLPESDTFAFSLKSEAAAGWLGVAFTKFKCAMVPADAVIAIPAASGSDADINSYKMEVASLSGVTVDEGQVLESAALSEVDGMQVLSFTRKADNGGEMVLDPTGPIEVIYAIGSDAELGYHGADGRGCLTINAQEP
eukprot:evm.model.scf_2052.2 EVM.evm.TU.scf_2052.2   scf_2052:17302-21702(-)